MKYELYGYYALFKENIFFQKLLFFINFIQIIFDVQITKFNENIEYDI